MAEIDNIKSKSYLRWIVLIVVTGLVISYLAFQAFPGSARYFLTVGEFADRSELHQGQIVRVSGTLVGESFVRSSGSTTSNFRLIDKDLPDGSSLEASYVGVLPDLFFNPNSEIILEGSYHNSGEFIADNILVKCPSKYQELEDQGDQGPYKDPV